MINTIFTNSDIIIYWDKNECTSKNKTYYVYLNGHNVAKTSKTHVTIRNINYESCSVEIITDENKIFYKKTIMMPKKKKCIDVTTAPYNAIGDGRTINTHALQKAIDDCDENGYVYIPKGNFLTGALNLHSNMELYIDNGGVIQGSDNPQDYLPKVWSRFEGIEMECYSSLINMGDIQNREEYCCKNVIIHGGGEICGGGRTLAENIITTEKERLKEYMMSLGDEINTYEKLDTIPGRLRPKLINISCSKNIVIDNIKIANGSCWNVHMIYSDNIVTCNSSFYSHDVWNGDGWDPDSSTNCTLFNCDFDTGDDCIAIKSGKNPEGNIIAKPCENINVFDCRCVDGHGVAIGSEMSGGIRDVSIWDCDFSKSLFGIHIKATKKRGGYVKNINVSNCIIPRLSMHSVGYNDDGIGAEKPPIFSDCLFENLTIFGEARDYGKIEVEPCDAIELVGFDKNYKIKNITFKDIIIDNRHSSVKQTISMQMLENVNICNISVR